MNFNYDIKDLENTNILELLKYKQLWIVTTEFMGGETQKLLSEYVKKGGHLILYPTIPTLDLYLNPCSVLKDELKIQFTKSTGSNKVAAFNIEDLFTVSREIQIFHKKDFETVSTTKDGEVCGTRKNIGKGEATILGFAFGYTTDEHLHLIEKLVTLDKIKRQAKVSDPDIQFVIRKGKKYSYLFLLNYHNQKKIFSVNEKKYTMNPFSCKVIKTQL